jgi:NAD(P)-dependent dehydrogenase (short-subunit alcohol dehydrogenase family)
LELGLEGRTALITGGSKGIGYASAYRLAQEGCNVHLASRTEADLEKASAEIRGRYNVEVTIHPTDLSDGDAARALIAVCKDIDILVNNAGAIPGGDIAAIQEPRWREAWDLKVFGYVNTSRAAYANMKARGKGVIVNVIGAAGERPSAGYIAGSAGNASLMAFTRGLGGRSRADNIRVVAINPGLTRTDRMITLMRTWAEKDLGDPERWEEMLDADFPPAEPEEIAAMVAFLASDLSASTTGTVITIDGGMSSR